MRNPKGEFDMTDLINDFWEKMDDVRSAMLGFKGSGRLVAMSPKIDSDLPGHVWFITAKGTDLAKGVAGGAQESRLVVASDSAGLYADIDGTLSHSTDREALDEVWSFVADAWFEGGKNDPDICLLQFTPSAGEVSVTPTSGVKFLYEIAKAKVTGDRPDMGAQGAVIF
jgi:general stress protein 26